MNASRALAACVLSALAAAACAPRTATMTDAQMMEAAQAAATPGANHAWLMDGLGDWKGTSESWMSPGATATKVDARYTVTSMLGGRFTETRYFSEMPGMGPFEGYCLMGYDNGAREFQAAWVDSYGTAMMTGSGRLSGDGTTIEMDFSYFCPIRKQRTPMWQTVTRVGKDREVHRMWGLDMATGAKYLLMQGEFSRVAR